jgi:DNA-binding NtrC family response regulator
VAERRILIVDDEESVRYPIRTFFAGEGFDVREADSVSSAVDSFRLARPDLAILDYSLPDGDGLELLAQLRELDSGVPMVVLTAHGSIDLAVKAIKEGAEQFLTKPVELKALLLVARRLLEAARMRHVTAAGRSREARSAVDVFAGESPAIKRLEQQASRVARSSVPVLILGETGSGKGVLARWIHQNGPRAEEAFVDLNCAGLSRELLENELFGHQKGAFTGAVSGKVGLLETAHRGTLFLDEIGEMDLQVQAKLLKVIEELRFRRLGDVRDREVDARLITATHRDLAKQVQESSFREDLYYRIKAIPLAVPSLRERGRDVVLLARALVERIGAELGRSGVALSGGAERALEAYSWPGNIRELRNVLEHAVLLADRTQLEAEDLREGLGSQATARPVAGAPSVAAGATLAEAEKQHIQGVLATQGFVVPRAAQVLGISRTALYDRIKKYAIPLPKRR